MPKDGLSDSDLVHAFRAGSRDAFAQLVLRHRRRIVHLAAAVLGDPMGGEDVAQEVSYQAFFEIARPREPARFGAWLSGITVNLARTALRRPMTLSPDELAGVTHAQFEPEDLSPSPELVVETLELQARVRAALELLPEAMRAAVWLHYVEGMSYQEIVGITGIQPGRLRVLSHRTRIRLQRELAGEWHRRGAGKERRKLMQVDVDSVWIRVRKDGEFDAVRRSPRWVLILKARDADRAMSVFIGPSEANAFAMQLAGLDRVRPQTYTFIKRLLDGVKATIQHVTVNDLVDDTFLATVSLQAGRSHSEIDARPSDALNLALTSGASIYLSDAVLERVGFPYSELTSRLDAATAGQDNEGLEWRSGIDWVRQVQENEQRLMREERASVQHAVRGIGPI